VDKLRCNRRGAERGEEKRTLRLSIRRQIEHCLEELRRGELKEEHLQEVLAAIDSAPMKRQDLLYLQTSGTSVGAGVLGMALVQNGEIQPVPDDPGEWPYQTVLEAIRDGWRVIQFPNVALLLDESRTYGLGCEFILEREG
jgi:hypothetical protein